MSTHPFQIPMKNWRIMSVKVIYSTCNPHKLFDTHETLDHLQLLTRYSRKV